MLRDVKQEEQSRGSSGDGGRPAAYAKVIGAMSLRRLADSLCQVRACFFFCFLFCFVDLNDVRLCYLYDSRFLNKEWLLLFETRRPPW